VAIKETLDYLRGRSRASIVGELLAGVREGGKPTAEVPVYESETEALRMELTGSAGGRDGLANSPRIIVLMCHQERDEVFDLLGKLGARPVDVATDLAELIPRLQERPES